MQNKTTTECKECRGTGFNKEKFTGTLEKPYVTHPNCTSCKGTGKQEQTMEERNIHREIEEYWGYMVNPKDGQIMQNKVLYKVVNKVIEFATKQAIQNRNKEIVEIIKKIPDTCPDLESDNYDCGLQDMKRQSIKAINQEGDE